MKTRARTAVTALVCLLLAGLVAAMSAATASATATAGTSARQALVLRSGTTTDAFELQTLEAINAVRGQHGLAPIRRVVPCLDGMAEDWGRRMAEQGIWEHRDQMSVVRTCRLAWTGETLARGTFTPGSLVQAWMDSPPHREILLTGRARLAGIDVRPGPAGGVVAVLNLGDRR